MAEEKKIQKEEKSPKIDRRSFLKGAATAAAVAVTATGGVMALLPSSADAQPPPEPVKRELPKALWERLPRAHQILDPGEKEDDVGDLVNLYVATIDEGLTKIDRVVEKLIMDERFRSSFKRNSSSAIRSQVQLNTPFPMDGIKVPASILEKAKAAKAEGWHFHVQPCCSVVGITICAFHTHITW